MVIAYPDYACNLASGFALFFAIFGTAGNLITIIALIKSPQIRKHPTTYFLLSLTVSDCMVCLISMPMQSVRYYNKAWVFGDALCKVFPVVLYSNIAISTLSMVLMTLNRLCLISFQQYYNKFYKKSYIWTQLIVAWTSIILLMMLPLFGIWGTLGLDNETFSCTILKKNGTSPKKFIFFVGFILPCCVILVSYSCIFWKVRQQKGKLEKFDTTQSSSRNKPKFFRSKTESRLTIMMLTIFLASVVCFLPLMIANNFIKETEYPAFHIMASICAWSSAVINPIIYAVGSSQYRKAYKNLFVNIQTNWRASITSEATSRIQVSKSVIDKNKTVNQKVLSQPPKDTPIEIT